MNEKIDLALQRLTKRAEMSDPTVLVATFVGTGMLKTVLESRDHQVIYGRGTGKTHALLYLSEIKRQAGELCAFVDMRLIGSSVGLFSDDSVPIAERATRLRRDTLGAIHDRLYDIATTPGESLDLGAIGEKLDAFIDSATETQVIGTATAEKQTVDGQREEATTSMSGGVASTVPNISLTASDKRETNRSAQEKNPALGADASPRPIRCRRPNDPRYCRSIAPLRIWIVLDEWSAVPVDLQPFLADMIRRCLLPVAGITVKIAAIEQRTRFLIPGETGDYTGIEIGADVAADLNLDDFMVFENDASRAVEFFRRLFFNHFKTVQNDPELQFSTDEEFARDAFTQRTAPGGVLRGAGAELTPAFRCALLHQWEPAGAEAKQRRGS